MPFDRSLYPDNWEQIRDVILIRAGGQPGQPAIGARCEQCGVRNYSTGWRDAGAEGEFVLLAEFDEYAAARHLADEENLLPTREFKRIVIVLTIAHLDDPDPLNCDIENLAALCQKCHNTLDAPMRVKNRQINANGGFVQLEMF